MDEMYKRIQNGLNRWMRTVGMSQETSFERDEEEHDFWGFY